jgi:hypothetical protein
VGRDNHPRQRQAAALARKKGTRPPYDRVLIVCEGAKTEPIYLDDIRLENRVSSAHVKVLHSSYGTEPRQIVNFARDTFLQSRAFERVFAVFDRDQHNSYHDALQEASRLDGSLKNDERKPVRFMAIPSSPCFELWLLLHFADIQTYFDRQEAFKRLSREISGYSKGMDGIYKLTQPNLDVAISRATGLQNRFSAHQDGDPFTNVNIVVSLLRSLGAQKRSS